MRKRDGRFVGKKLRIAVASLALLASSTAAEARGLMILNVQVTQSLILLIASGSVCISYTYDANGNRTAQTVATIGAGPTQWGSGTYGCFLWSAP